MARFAPHILALTLALAASGWAQAATDEKDAERRTTIDLSAEASRAAPNDMASAVAYVEVSGRAPDALSREVNQTIAAALAEIKAYPTVKARTLGVHTFPLYGKEGRRIEGWRIRSEILIESQDIPAVSELLGKLQNTVAISSLAMQPSPETRKQAADMAATDAIHAFQARAETLARTFGKPYRIRHLAVGYGDAIPPPRPMMRAATMAAEAAPMPVEAGESQVSVSVSGTIELTE